jgi:hypothetical protein
MTRHDDDDFANPHARGPSRYSAATAASPSHRAFPPEQLIPPAAPHVVAREKARQAAALAASDNRGSLAWAYRLQERKANGEKLALCQERALAAVFPHVATEAELEAQAERAAIMAVEAEQ